MKFFLRIIFLKTEPFWRTHRAGQRKCRSGSKLSKWVVCSVLIGLVWCVQCGVMSCHVMWYGVMLCDVMSCHVMWCHVMWCDVISCYVISSYVIWFHIMYYSMLRCNMMSYDVLWRRIEWYFIILYNITWYNVTWHDVMQWDDVECSVFLWHTQLTSFYFYLQLFNSFLSISFIAFIAQFLK